MENFDVLIVDDDPVNLQILKTRLNKTGYLFKTASNGTQALDWIDKSRFDVVITDLMMPGVDGMDILDIVKKHNPNIDVIIMTAYATVDNAVEALKRGAVDYLQKPINLEELSMRLQKLMLMKSLTHRTDELQAAMDITERSAAETIKNLEDMVMQSQGYCTDAIDVLLDERIKIPERIARAVEILRRAK